jgi:hypothetical protein
MIVLPGLQIDMINRALSELIRNSAIAAGLVKNPIKQLFKRFPVRREFLN